MKLKRSGQLYVLMGTVVIQHTPVDNPNPTVLLSGAGISPTPLYEGDKHIAVFDGITGELAKKSVDYVDLDAVIERIDPPTTEPEEPTEAPAPTE